MKKKITHLTTIFLFLIGMFQMQGQLYSGVQVSDVGTSNSIGTSSGSKSVVVGNDGGIYAVFSGDAGIRVAKSTNRGQSYLPSVQVSTDSFESEIAVSSNGTIYVAWTSNNDGNIYLATSTDGATTFSAPNLVGSGYGVHIATNGSKVFLIPSQGSVVYSNLTNGIGAFTAANTNTGFAFSDIFVDSSNGSVYIIGDTPDVTLYKSTDDGITFNPIVLSTNIDIYYSSYAFSNGNLGAHIFVGGTGTDGYKINLSNGLVTATPLMNSNTPQGRTLLADEFGNFVDGYDDGSSLYFRVSNDQGTTWQLPVTVASGLNLNLGRNHNFQDVVAIYAANNIIYSNVYKSALIPEVQVSDVGLSNSIGTSSGSKSVVVGNDGAIYAVFNGDAGIRVAKSTNRGQSYLPSVQVSTDSFESEIAISSNGTIYVAWTSNNDGNIYLATSTDGGTTFSAPNLVGSGFGVHIATNGSKVFLIPSQGSVVYSNLTNGIGAFTAANTNTSFAFSDIFVDSSNGSVYIIGDTPDVTLYKSTDDGITFNPIVLSTNIDIYYSSYAFSNGNLGAHIFVGGSDLGGGGSGTNGYKINLSNGLVTATPLMNCVTGQARTLLADEFGNFVDGYDDGSSLYFRVSNDQGTTWQQPNTVATGTYLNLGRNHNFQDVVAIYGFNGVIYSKVYKSALTSGAGATYYADVDGDGFGDAASSIQATAQPTGYVTNSLDCNDNQLQYADLDADGFGSTTLVACGIIDNTDCNDNEVRYLDADADGYGDVAMIKVACGGSLLSTDCNDAVASINPGAIDVCYDGIDNDCNGVIDNVGQPGGCTPKVSSLIPSLCGATLSNLNATLSCTFATGAQGFRFRVTKVDMDTNAPLTAPVIINRSVANFSLSNVVAVSYNSKYQVEVSVKYNNVYQPFYSNPCYITIASPVATIGSQCGSTLNLMNQWVNSNVVPQVGAYKFRVTQLNGQGTPVGTSQEFVSGQARFNMGQFVGALYNTPYSVEVSVRNTDLNYLAYNAPCTITTPAYPTAQVREAQCNGYLVPNNTAYVYADVVSGAAAYRFRVYLVDGSNNVVYDYSMDSSFNRFTLNNFPGLVAGTTYTVQVAVRMTGQSVFGPYNKQCTIVTPGASRTLNSETALEVANVFEAIAFPNPFAENFKLEVKTNNEADLEIRVYDMIGKLVEQKTVTATDIQTIEVGSNYPSGVYNVIVSQEQTTKTLRVIKR